MMGEQSKPYRSTYLNPDYRRDPKTKLYCAACQKDIRSQKTARAVHLIEGGLRVLHPDDEPLYAEHGDPKSDLGTHYLGPDCARKLGLEWSRPA